MRHAEFAELAARRLETVADRLEEQSKRLGVDQETLARAQELRVAAVIVRDEAAVREAVEGRRSEQRRFSRLPRGEKCSTPH